jgi:phosphinothricin acetyltransferase
VVYFAKETAKMNLAFVEIQEHDLKLVKEIYDYYILHSTATFHTRKLTIRQLKASIPVGHPRYRSFLMVYNGEICGFSYLAQYKKRQAYNRTAEITVYLKPAYYGKGIGMETIKKLESVARDAGIGVLIGTIS